MFLHLQCSFSSFRFNYKVFNSAFFEPMLDLRKFFVCEIRNVSLATGENGKYLIKLMLPEGQGRAKTKEIFFKFYWKISSLTLQVEIRKKVAKEFLLLFPVVRRWKRGNFKLHLWNLIKKVLLVILRYNRYAASQTEKLWSV